MKQYPIFIISRDRLSCLEKLVGWLETAGQERIYIIDNESTYEPLLDFYSETPHQVVKMGGNTGHVGIWAHGTIEKLAPGERFVVTDPDIVPIEQCPNDAIEYFDLLLDQYQDRSKIGFGLWLEDIPDHYKFKQSVLEYESRFALYHRPQKDLYFAPIDTTFALYREGASQDISFSGRTDYPYVARHLSWYVDSDNPGEEETYYIDHAHSRINSWNHLDLPWWLGGNR